MFALIFYAMPIFWVALMGILLFSVTMDWLPSFGYETVGANLTGLAHAVDVAKHLVMPAMTLGLFFMATYTRMTRASMLEVKRLDFVKTARAKGLSDAVIQRRHVLRNALLPVVTLAGVHSGTLIGGAVITETVFAWPGIGRLMYDALLQRDYNLLLGVFVICSAMVLIFNLITDLVYRLVDPRFAAYFSPERPAKIRLDEVVWGGVAQDGIPPLRSPGMIAAGEAGYRDHFNSLHAAGSR